MPLEVPVRMISLLMTLLVVAWLVYVQLGDKAPAAEQQASFRQAEQKAAAVQSQVDDQFARQAGQLSRMEGNETAP